MISPAASETGNKDDPQDYLYKLVGIVVHNGNASAGHYYSFINVDPEKDHWVEFNDSTISEFDFSKVEAECYGGNGGPDESGAAYMEEIGDIANIISCGRSKSAYMLVYEKKIKGLIPEEIPPTTIAKEDVVVSSLECDSTAISRAGNARLILRSSDGSSSVLHRFHELPYRIPQIVAEVFDVSNAL